jgi:hypothetical protein
MYEVFEYDSELGLVQLATWGRVFLGLIEIRTMAADISITETASIRYLK